MLQLTVPPSALLQAARVHSGYRGSNILVEVMFLAELSWTGLAV